MAASFTLKELELTLDTASIVEAHDNGVKVATRDGITLELDSLLVDRIVREHLAQKARETEEAAAQWRQTELDRHADAAIELTGGQR